MKEINGKKFLEGSDKVVVSWTIIANHYGCNVLLNGTSGIYGKMTWKEYKELRAKGAFPDDDGVCEYQWNVIPYAFWKKWHEEDFAD